MATSQISRVIQTLRQATVPQEVVGLTDGQLLERYLRTREEAAFAALVRRHGPMVWGVCRRILGSHHDVEDAFQATFLVLVRKAASIMSKGLVANWLYGVAHQTALKARAQAAKRRTREKQVIAMPEPAVQQQQLWNDLQGLLDQELSRLPHKYRAVIVLCDLEGKTRKEAARHFHLPEGTVATRLATARTILAKRLARQGLAVSGAALGALLSRQPASASVPVAVASATIEAARLFAEGEVAALGVLSMKAISLTEGVIQSMLLAKLKITTAILVVAFLSGWAVALTFTGPAEKPADQRVMRKKESVAHRATEKKEPVAQAVTEKKEPAVQPVTEKKQGEIRNKVVSGIAKAVAAEKHTLTVAHQQGEDTFTVAPDAIIEIDGKPGTLAGLPAGANVTLNLQVDQKTVLRISASGASIFGSVKAVDLVKNTITVSGHPEDRTFSVPADTAIMIDAKPGTLARIPTGAGLHALNLRVDQHSASGINVLGPGYHHVPVKAVDTKKQTITIDDQAPATVAGITLPVAADATIQIDGKPGQLAGIPAGSFVNLGLSVDQQTARNLQAEGPNLGGCGGSQVTAVDAEKSTITLDDKAAAEVAGKTFTVFKDAFIQIDGKPGKLAELPTGSYVNLTLTVDRQTVRCLGAQGPRVAGVVKAVDAAKNSVTVDATTYLVAQDATVVIDGKRERLANLTTGAMVNLNLRVDQKTVTMIQTKTP